MRNFLLLLFFISWAFCQTQYGALSLETPPTIDGDLSEYQDKMFIFLPHSDIPETLWRGPQDAEAKIWMCWDKGNLYIASEVWDDFLAQKGEPWQESLQLCLAPDLEITCSALQNKLFAFKNGVPLEVSFPYAMKSTNASYQVEIAIPWSLLEITPPATASEEVVKELSLKFNAVLYDTDMGSYRGYLSWAPVKDWKEGMGIVRDTSQFGDVRVSTQPIATLQIAFFFAPSPLYVSDEDVDIVPWLMFNSDFKGKFRFTLKRGEETLLEKEEQLEKPAGFSPFTIRWDARGKPEGSYIAEAELTIEGMEITPSATLTINKYDAQRLANSLQEELNNMAQSIAQIQPPKNWRDAVIVLQGNAWQSRASPLLELIHKKIKETAQADPDACVLAKAFLWNSREDVAMLKGSSALIRREFQSPALQPFPTLKLPASKELTYVWNWERWQEGGSYERLSLLYANLPIASAALWTHQNPAVLSLQMDSLLGDLGDSFISSEKIGGADWQGLIVVSPQGGARLITLQGNNLWLFEALSREACLFLLNSALSGKPISKIDSLLPPLQPDIFVEDVGNAIGFNFSTACFFAAKDDRESLLLAQALRDKVGGKMARLEEVNRYKDVVIVGSTALHQLISGFKLPAPERTAYILSRYLWGKNLLILVGKEPEGTRLAVEVLGDLIDYIKDRKMLVGDVQSFTAFSSGELSPLQLCLSAMGGLCDFLGIADKGTREGAKDALWLSAEKSWKLTILPGETFSFSKGNIVSLGTIERVDPEQEIRDLLSSIHQAGGIAILGGKDESLRGLPFDAWLMGRVGSRWKGKPFVAGTMGDFSSSSRTIVCSKGEGIYDILSAIRRGDCLAFSPYQRLGSEKVNRILNILIDERAQLSRMFEERVREKAGAFSY